MDCGWLSSGEVAEADVSPLSLVMLEVECEGGAARADAREQRKNRRLRCR